MDLKEQMTAELQKARAIAKAAEDAGREMTDQEVSDANTHLKAYTGLKGQLESAAGSTAVKDALAAIAAETGMQQSDPHGGKTPEGFAKVKGFKTIGEMFVESDAYTQMMKSFPDGRIQENARVQSAPYGVKALVTGLSDSSGGAFITTDRQDDVERLGRRPLTIRDIVSKRTTTSDTVDFIQQTVQMTSAAVVPEATTAAAPTAPGSAGALVLPAGGGYKPEGSIAFTLVTANVKTIAEWVPATKRGLADASQLRGLIDQELREDLAEKEEDQILNGNGSGENMTGILQTSGIQTQATSNTTAGLDSRIETTLKAKTKILTVGRARPTAYVFNPLDWEAIALARLAKNPANEGTGVAVETHHGLPVVLSEGIAQGTALIGDFRKAVIWDREQASITATDSHADFFIRNLVAILGEQREAFGVLRPKAFCRITLPAIS